MNLSIKYFTACLLLFIGFGAGAQHTDYKLISGEYYDWKKTMKPEKPWRRDYSQTVVMKLMLCTRDSVGGVKQVYLRFEDVLEQVKKLDRITIGIPKIIYLVGWQAAGHDSKYPSFTIVNDSLKRKQDRTALESLHWLIKEARKYNTTVSLHINLIDAFKDSPLWQVYDENNIIIKDKNGQPVPGEVFDGMQSYQIDYAQEWKTGYTVKRIDSLLSMLPELKQGGTIHVDAFHTIQPVRSKEIKDSIANPFLGTTLQEEAATQRKIFRYWRAHNIDVTSEGGMYWLRIDPFIGLQPMAWWYNAEEFEKSNWLGKPKDFKSLPANLYTGTPMHAEQEVKTDPENLSGLIKEFCTSVVPWYYANNTAVKKDKQIWELTGGNIFLPALWKANTIVAYSENGYSKRKWKLPSEWNSFKKVTATRLSVKKTVGRTVIPIVDGTITLKLEPGQAVIIQP